MGVQITSPCPDPATRRSGDLATALWRARTEGGVIRRAAADGLASVEMAYGVQRQITSLAGLSRLGWKVGVTSMAAQRLLGIETPATGPLFADHCVDSPAEIAVFPGQDASVESEFAFRFAGDLPPREAVYGRAEVLAAVGARHAPGEGRQSSGFRSSRSRGNDEPPLRWRGRLEAEEWKDYKRMDDKALILGLPCL